ncbi:claudin-like protein ZF-A89 [Amia ocellicauda]|uniref:claudin-like protein ZF-A89 n=1 Tax=Amia ocellicauda TaxID=2972642 RepID=UPI003464E5BE
MPTKVAEIVAFVLSSVGWLGAVLTRSLPVWNVTGSLGNHTSELPVYWDGVWIGWEQHNSGRLQCSFYESLLGLSGHFRTWRALIMASIGVGFFSIAICAIGLLKFPDRVQVAVASGAVSVLSGFLLLIPVSWTAHSSTTDLQSLVSLHRGLGVALYMGWGASALLAGGGALLCSRGCSVKEQTAPTPEQNHAFQRIHSAAAVV